MGLIEAALADLESLKLGEWVNYAAIAKKHGLDWSTLSKRHWGVHSSCEVGYENQRILNN